MTRLVTNFALFQAGWFACVLGAAWGRPWTGAALALAAAAWHVARAARPGGELALVLIAAAFGAAFDSLLAASGWLVYASPVPWAGLAPVWIVALWACFATTLNVSLGWLKGRHVLAAVLGAAGGPLAYLAGEALGGVTLSARTPSLAALAAGWAVAMPLLLLIAARLERRAGVTLPRLPAVH